MQDHCKRLAAALCALLLSVTFSCCSESEPPPAQVAPDEAPVSAEPSAPLFSEGERTLSVLRRLGTAPLCLRLSTSSEELFFSGELTLYTDGENAACFLETDGERLASLLTGGDEWVVRYGDETYYKSGDGYLTDLLEDLSALADADGYAFDCGETIYEGASYDYESFMDGERNVTLLFAPDTAELMLALIDREAIDVLEISGDIPDGVFDLPTGFSLIHP
ncbi:MAG: hypothetical protein IK101_07755 [Oscillospiraceae bacterium]|nr:hypothetical protein [Oscillospiraceae bacterium]